MLVSDIFTSKYLSAADLKGEEHTVVIATVESQDLPDNTKKLLVSFQNRKKGLLANKTNSARIAMLYGNDTDKWIGKEITLYTDIVDFQGKPTEAIRVRPPKRKNATPPPADEEF